MADSTYATIALSTRPIGPGEAGEQCAGEVYSCPNPAAVQVTWSYAEVTPGGASPVKALSWFGCAVPAHQVAE